MRKLNLGSGDRPIDGYDNIDIKDGRLVYPLDEPDVSADEIRASHVLEHFSHRDTESILREWLRVLKPGGLLKIAVPDFDLICQWHASGQMERAEAYLMGGHIDENDIHGAAISRRTLAAMFCKLGLEAVREWPGDNEDCSTLDISLNLEGRKPLTDCKEIVGVYGVLPSARYGPAMHQDSVHKLCAKYAIKMRMTGGCFWNQHLCPAMEQCTAEPDCKYVLTFDYDSVFEPEDVLRLYRIMETHPHIDAVSPMQSHRGLPTPLFTLAGKAAMPASELEELVFPVSTSHFGLTMIRASTLRELPHPWMMGQPDETGRWGQNRIDPDIWFWRKWAEHGFTIYVSPQVSIGHIDEVILWPAKKDLAPIFQKSSDYLSHGKPLEAL